MYAVGQNVEQKLVCKQRSEICLVSGINCLNHFAISWNSVFCSFTPFHARHFIIHSADSSPTDCLLHLSLDDVRIFRLPVEFFYARQLFFSFFSLINNRKRGHAIITANSLGLFFLFSFFLIFFPPKTVPTIHHWKQGRAAWSQFAFQHFCQKADLNLKKNRALSVRCRIYAYFRGHSKGIFCQNLPKCRGFTVNQTNHWTCLFVGFLVCAANSISR